MPRRKELQVHANNVMMTIDDHIKFSEPFHPKGRRSFKYDLNDKATKAKLVKASKRAPFLLEEHSSSSNLVFSAGSWYNTVLPSISYWNDVKEEQSCHVGDSVIRIIGIKAGQDASGMLVDSQIVFFVDRDKVTCHFYNTTQKILVNGHGYKKFIDIFLKPYFMSKIDSCLPDINSYNEFLLDKLGHRTVKRSTVRSKGVQLDCNKCDFETNAVSSLKRHKKYKHTVSFEASLSLKEHPQSTRNNSIVEKMMQEDASLSEATKASVTLDEMVLGFTCLECKYKTKSKAHMDAHIEGEHESNTNEEVFFSCKQCNHDFVDVGDLNNHMKTHKKNLVTDTADDFNNIQNLMFCHILDFLSHEKPSIGVLENADEEQNKKN